MPSPFLLCSSTSLENSKETQKKADECVRDQNFTVNKAAGGVHFFQAMLATPRLSTLAGVTESPSPRRGDTSGFQFQLEAPDVTGEHRLREEVLFLQRKVKYIHSVSTIFRQKIALIMREMSKNPAQGFSDHQKQYTLALTELTRAEADGEVIALDAQHDVSAPAPQGGSPSHTARNKESIQKAHQLCVILQEKNTLKQREVELRAELAKQRDAYAELYDRHQKFVEVQASGSVGTPGVSHANAELQREREETLQRQLERAQEDILQLRASRVMGNNLGQDPQLAETSLLKQNNMLKTRIAKLKDELTFALESRTTNATDMQDCVSQLSTQLQQQRQDLESRDRLIRILRQEKNDLAKELVSQRATEEYLQTKIAALEGAHGGRGAAGLSAEQHHHAAKGDGGHASALQLAAANGDRSASAMALSEVDRLTTKIARLEEDLANTRELCIRERGLNAQKDAEISALGAQLRSFRARMDAAEAERTQREMQQTMIQDVESRMLAAVRDIRQSQTTESLSRQVSGIQGQLSRLEGLELQLRHKEDALALLEDEVEHHRASHHALRQSLCAISSLFIHFPRSVEAFERMVIELEEYKNEVRRCSENRELPDLLKVETAVELRNLEAETQRRVARQGGGNSSGLHTLGSDDEDTKHGAPFGQYQGGEDGIGVGGDSEEEFVMPANAILPPPPLVDITAEASAAYTSGVSPSPAGISASMPSSNGGDTGVTAGGPSSGEIGDDDVRLTFQLFDEHNAGVLPMDAIRLCLSTLGLPSASLPSHQSSMSAGEFLATCLRLRRKRI